MKKLLLILPVIALAACSQEQKTLVSGCEKIGSDEFSTIYKCPVTEELVAIQGGEAVAMFRSDAGVDIAAIAADAENIYVNVAAEDKCETEGQVAYRVMVKEPKLDGKAMYAVAVCK